MNRRIFLGWVVAVLLMSVPAGAQQKVVKVAAAADTRFAMPEVAAAFEKDSSIKVEVTFGASGNFFGQLQNGAPFDMFFSADMEYPKKLDAAGLVEAGSLYEYARGKLALYFPAGSKLGAEKRNLAGLMDEQVKKVAIANPEHAPYGRAAVSALKNAGLYKKIQSKLVYGEDISQTAQFAQSGNADAAIIAKSLSYAPNMKNAGTIVDLPAGSYEAIRQAAVIMKSAQNKEAARAFEEFVKSAKGQAIFSKYGLPLQDDGVGTNP